MDPSVPPAIWPETPGSSPTIPKKRGRPPGSLNKSTVTRWANQRDAPNTDQQLKRSRGRPLGSKNKPKPDSETSHILIQVNPGMPIKRGRGRPKGSKNKAKSASIGELLTFTDVDGNIPDASTHLAEVVKHSEHRDNHFRSILSEVNHHSDERSPEIQDRTHSPIASAQFTLPEVSPVGHPRSSPYIPDAGPSQIASERTQTYSITVANHMGSNFSIDAFFVVSLEEDENILQMNAGRSGRNLMSSQQDRIPSYVQESFDRYRKTYLSRDPSSSMPQLYATLRTFWLPQESDILHHSSSNSVQVQATPRFFAWDPLPLVSGGFHCPNQGCFNELDRLSDWVTPRKVNDMSGSYWIIGALYRCSSCAHSPDRSLQRTFLTWDPKIVNSLPSGVSCEFPLHLTPHGGVDKNLYSLMQTCLNQGLGAKYFSDALLAYHSEQANRSPQQSNVFYHSSSVMPVTPISASHTQPIPDSHPTIPPSQTTRHSSYSRNGNLEHPSERSALFPRHDILHSEPSHPDILPPTTSYLHHNMTREPDIGDNEVVHINANESPAPSASYSALSGGPHMSSNFLSRALGPTDDDAADNSSGIRPRMAIFDVPDDSSDQSGVLRTLKRRPRTCRRCGRVGIHVAGPTAQGCSGASDVKNCKNPCRDCGSHDCPGRDPKKWQGKTPCPNFRRGHIGRE